MFIVHYDEVPENFSFMVINKKECVVQKVDDDAITIHEWVYPVLWHDDECEEISVTCDEIITWLLGKNTFFKVSKKFIYFEDYTYKFHPGEILCFETRLPKLIAIISPCVNMPIMGEDVVTLKITDTLNMHGGKGSILHTRIIHKFENFEKGVTIDMKYFPKTFSKPWKLYMEEDFPICIETLDPVKRVYIAPCLE